MCIYLFWDGAKNYAHRLDYTSLHSLCAIAPKAWDTEHSKHQLLETIFDTGCSSPYGSVGKGEVILPAKRPETFIAERIP